MTKPIKSFPKSEQSIVISRRLKNKTDGLGYASALEARAILDNKAEVK